MGNESHSSSRLLHCLLSAINLCFDVCVLQLSPISADSVLDLVIIGCGPAGLSLAAESAKRGLRVGLIGPDLPFTNNYGVWEDEFKGTDHIGELPTFSLKSFIFQCALRFLCIWN